MAEYLSIARRALERPKDPRQLDSLEDVLRDVAIELWSDTASRFFIVANEKDARRLGEPRGDVYTAAELRRVIQISDPAIVREIQRWKQVFDGNVREAHARKGAGVRK